MTDRSRYPTDADIAEQDAELAAYLRANPTHAESIEQLQALSPRECCAYMNGAMDALRMAFPDDGSEADPVGIRAYLIALYRRYLDPERGARSLTR